MTYKRQCTNWLETFLEYTMPRSESPESMLFFSGLFALSSALRRHVKVGRDMMGGYDIYPHIYLLFIAPAGVVKKSTTLGFAEEFIDSIPGITKCPASITVPALLLRMSKAPDVSLCIISSEFSTLIEKSGPTMFGYLTDLFDGKKKIDEETIGREYIFADNPCINIAAATTPDWISNNVHSSILSGGFGSRVISLYEDKPRQYKLYYNKIVNPEMYEKLHDSLLADLEHIANDIHGVFKIADDAQIFMEDWYQKNARNPGGEARKIDGYYQRRHVHAHKLAMLLHLSYSDELILTLEDFQQAISVLTEIESRIMMAFKSVGKNKYSADLMGICSYVIEKGKVYHSDLLNEFSSSAEPNKLIELIQFLVQAKKINADLEGVDVFYTPAEIKLKRVK